MRSLRLLVAFSLLLSLPALTPLSAAYPPTSSHRLHRFDNLVAGTVLGSQLEGVQFPGGPMVVRVEDHPEWGVVTASGKQALWKGTGSMTAVFDTAQSWVRVRVGNITDTKATLTLRVFALPGAPESLRDTVSVTLDAWTSVVVPVEVARVLAGDIRVVQLDTEPPVPVILDDLEAETVPTDQATRFDFDGLTQPYLSYLDGVRFVEQGWVRNLGIQAHSTPNVVESSGRGGEVSNPQPMTLMFDTPVRTVRLYAGAPSSATVSVRATLEGLDEGGTVVASVWAQLERLSAVDRLLQVSRWFEGDIKSVRLTYSDAEYETIDDLEVSPPMNTSVPDSVAPTVQAEFSSGGREWQVHLERAGQPVSAIVRATITEARGLSMVGLVHLANGQEVFRDEQLLSVTIQDAVDFTQYRVQATVTGLREGVNTIRVLARDRAGNVASNVQRDVTAELVVPWPVSVSGVPNLEFEGRRGLVIRDEPEYLEIPERGRRFEIAGLNLHENVRFYLRAYGDPGAPLVNLDHVGATHTNRVVQVLPETFNALGTYDVILRSDWPGYETNLTVGVYRSVEIPYPMVYGFGFVNEDDGAGFRDFTAVFKENSLLLPVPGLYDPLYMLYFAAVYAPAGEIVSGECLGYSAASMAIRDSQLDPGRFRAGTRYAAGLTQPNRPDHYRLNNLLLYEPELDSLWAHIVTYQGMQLSREAVLNVITQIRGRGMGFFSVGGNPMQRFRDLQANGTHEYAISMMPSVGKGHAMVPYALSEDPGSGRKIIHVYDPNKPYNHGLAETNAANVKALTARIEIDPASNQFTYTMAGGSVWSGYGLYLVPRSVLRGNHHAPGVELIGEGLALVYMLIAGEADAHYSAASGQEVGWAEDGSFTNSWEESVPMSFLGEGGDEIRSFILTVTNRGDAVTLRARANGPQFSYYGAQAGVAVTLRSLDGVAGETTQLSMNNEAERLTGFAVRAPHENARLVPSLGMAVSERERVVCQWGNLFNLPTGGEVEFNARREQGTAQFINRSGRVIRPVLEMRTSDNQGVTRTNLHGPVEAMAGAAVTLAYLNWPDTATLTAMVDDDNDGTAERAVPLVGRSTTPAAPEQDRNNNGIVDEADIASGGSEDTNSNGVPDEVERVDLLVSVEVPNSITFTGVEFPVNIRVANASGNPAAGAVVEIPIPPGSRAVRWTLDEAGDVVERDERLMWTVPSLAPGAGALLRLTLLAPGVPGRLFPGATVRAQEPEVELANNFSVEVATVRARRGGVLVTGRDLDYHAVMGPNFDAARLWLRKAVSYVTYDMPDPDILLVMDVRDPGGVSVNPQDGLAAAGLTRYLIADHGSGEPGVLNLASVDFRSFDVVVIASDYGGWLRQEQLDILNARSALLFDYVNAWGGGVVVLSQSGERLDGGYPGTSHDRYGFLPFVMSHALTQSEGGMVPGPAAGELGLSPQDLGGNVSHAFFSALGGLTPIDLDAQGRVISAVVRGHVLTQDGVERAADLSVSARAMQPRLTLGDTLTFEVVLANQGPDPSGPVQVQVAFPANATVNVAELLAAHPGGIYTDGILAFTSSLEPGQSSILTFRAQPTQVGTQNLGVAVRGDLPDPVQPNNGAIASAWVRRPYGGILVTAHDADAGASSGANPAGARHFLQQSIRYVTDAMPEPRVLLVTDLRHPGGDESMQADPRAGLMAAGFANFDVADYGSGEPGVLDLHTVDFALYDAIVVASDMRGWLRQDELDVLNARSGDLLASVNAGVGLVAFGESGGRVGGTYGGTTGNRFGFLPFLRSKMAGSPGEGNLLAPLGTSLGLDAGDVSGDPIRFVFDRTGGMTPVDLTAGGGIISVATRGRAVMSSGVAFTDLEVRTTGPQSAPVAGGVVEFLVEVTNLGPDPATRIEVADMVPAGAEFLGFQVDRGTWDLPLGNLYVRWLLGDLQLGATATATIQVRASESGMLTNVVSVVGNEVDVLATNNTGSTVVRVDPATPVEIRIVTIKLVESRVLVIWEGGQGQLQRCPALGSAPWEDVGPVSDSSAEDAVNPAGTMFYRVAGRPAGP